MYQASFGVSSVVFFSPSLVFMALRFSFLILVVDALHLVLLAQRNVCMSSELPLEELKIQCAILRHANKGFQ
jgi:hypothetical protein